MFDLTCDPYGITDCTGERKRVNHDRTSTCICNNSVKCHRNEFITVACHTARDGGGGREVDV
jgi:hypothetical protein